ncbi:MAG: hypothetical protein J5666_00730 [Bacilli bacterium]|nr:hypothetical protein [Bacilli bacterium]
MKKVLSVIMMIALSLVLVSCKAKPLDSATKSYYAVLNGEVISDSNKMEATTLNDKRVKTVRKNLKTATYLYLIEVEVKEGDTLQIVRTTTEGGAVNFSAQDKLSGPVTNLTEKTISIPEYTEFNNGNGTWNDLMKIKVTGKVVIIFAEKTQEKDIAVIVL